MEVKKTVDGRGYEPFEAVKYESTNSLFGYFKSFIYLCIVTNGYRKILLFNKYKICYSKSHFFNFPRFEVIFSSA